MFFVFLLPVFQCFCHIDLANMLYMDHIGDQACRRTEYHDDCHNKRRYPEVEETAHRVQHSRPYLSDEEILKRQEYDHRENNDPLGLGKIQLIDLFIPVSEHLKKRDKL